MIFGFRKGKIGVALEKYNFYPGETIKGRVSLQLKKPIQATSLRVSFIGMKIVTERGRVPGMSSMRAGSKGDLSRHGDRTTVNVPLYSFGLVLDREREYFKGEYPFEIKIPDNILEEKGPKLESKAQGALEKVMEIGRVLSHESTRIQWYIEARLAIPKSFDMVKKVDITLG